MSKIITTIFYIIFIVILAWIAVSWIEILLKNLDGITINSWNFFKVLPKFSVPPLFNIPFGKSF